MAKYFSESGLYWRPLGGNNIDQVSGHCYQYTDVVISEKAPKATTILVDLGKFDNHQALGIKNSVAAVPDIRELLQSPFLEPEAIFLTHSHPDHLNGIVHYVKAGICLPRLFGGRYTKLILEGLYDTYNIAENSRPIFNVVNAGDKIALGSLKIEVLASSHTCLDSFGLLIESASGVCVYHTGDMKTDNSTVFRKPTNLKYLQSLNGKIDFVVADFYNAACDGFATKEIDIYKKLVEIINNTDRKKIFIPVYPTHAEMYMIAFIAALKTKKNVVFYGNQDFYGYLNLIEKCDIDFKFLAKNRIDVAIGLDEAKVANFDDFVVVGTFNSIDAWFDVTEANSVAIITSGTFFNPLRGFLNARNITFVDVDKYPILQGNGHGGWRDIEAINTALGAPIFIPTHCPSYIIDNCRKLAQYTGVKVATPTAKNNHLYKLDKNNFSEIDGKPANWLVAKRVDQSVEFVEVWQQPTSGKGFLKRTLSDRRSKKNFEIMLQVRKKHGNQKMY